MEYVGFDYISFSGEIVCEKCGKLIQAGEKIPYPPDTKWFHKECRTPDHHTQENNANR